MDFGINGPLSDSQGNESDAVERFVRLLITNNELSLARNILEALGKKYNHLLFELEVKAGNYSKAVEIFNFMPKEKQEMYIHVVSNIENDANTVSESLEKILKEFSQANYPLVISEVQKVKREFPQITEIIAMELLTAIKRGDKKKIDLLYEILRQLDKTHPVLTQVKKNVSLSGIIVPALILSVFIIVLINLVVSLLNFTKSGALGLTKIEKEIASVEKRIIEYNSSTDAQFKKLADALSMLKTSVDYINEKLDKAQRTENSDFFDAFSDQLKLINDKLGLLEKEISKVSKSSTSDNAGSKYNSTDYYSLKQLAEEVKGIKNKLYVVESKLSNGQSYKDNQEVKGLYTSFENIRDRLEKIEKIIEENAIADANYKTGVQGSIETISYKLDELSKQVSLLKESFSQINTTNTSVSANSSTIDFEKRLKTLEDSLNSLYSDISKLLKQSSAENKEGTSAIADNLFEKRLNVIENKIDSLYSEFETLSKQVSQKNNSENGKSISVDSLQERVTLLENKVDSLRSDISLLSKQVSERDRQGEQYQQISSDDIKKRFETIESKLDTLSSEVASLSKRFSENEARVASQNVNVDTFEKRFESIENKINLLSSEISTIKEKLAKSSSAEQNINEESAKELANLKEQVTGLLTQVKNLSSQFDAEKETWNSKFSRLDQEVNTLRKSTEELSNAVLQMQKEIEKLKENLAKLSGSLSKSSSVQETETTAMNIETPAGGTSQNTIYQQAIPLSTSISDIKKDSQDSDPISQERNAAEKVISQTKDTKELFLAGLRFYLDGKYNSALIIFDYIQPRIANSNVYYKEDVYYYKIMCYIALGQKEEAIKEYEVYKNLYPAGQYLKELSTQFK